MSKGSKRRVENVKSINQNWDLIDWAGNKQEKNLDNPQECYKLEKITLSRAEFNNLSENQNENKFNKFKKYLPYLGEEPNQWLLGEKIDEKIVWKEIEIKD